jgi:uncharacterized membrane protein
MFSIIILLAIFLIALMIVAVFLLGWYLFNKREGIGEEGEDTLEALDRRLAAGEIRKDEHERLSSLVRSRAAAAGDRDR